MGQGTPERQGEKLSQERGGKNSICRFAHCLPLSLSSKWPSLSQNSNEGYSRGSNFCIVSPPPGPEEDRSACQFWQNGYLFLNPSTFHSGVFVTSQRGAEADSLLWEVVVNGSRETLDVLAFLQVRHVTFDSLWEHRSRPAPEQWRLWCFPSPRCLTGSWHSINT